MWSFLDQSQSLLRNFRQKAGIAILPVLRRLPYRADEHPRKSTSLPINIGTFQFLPTGLHGLCFAFCFAGPLPLRCLFHGPLLRVHFGESLVLDYTQFLPTGLHGLYFGFCFAGPLPLRSLFHGPLLRVHFGESLVLDYTQKSTISTLALKLSVSAIIYPRWTATKIILQLRMYCFITRPYCVLIKRQS